MALSSRRAGFRAFIAIAAWVAAFQVHAQPTVTLAATPQQALAPATVHLEAHAYAPSWARTNQVRFLVNGSYSLGTIWAPGPYTMYVSGLAAGSYAFQAEAWNVDGPGYSPVVNVTVATPNSQPVVVLDAPASTVVGAVNRVVSIRATAYDQDGTTAGVHFYDGYAYIGSDLSAPFEISWTPTAGGSHAISAVAIDDVGATSVAGTNIDIIFSDSFEDSCVLDPDSDRLVDCEETAYGTDPNLPDTDFDGLSDGDEVRITEGGLNLPAMGVDPLRKDILVEYDWTSDSVSCGEHSHLPPSIIFEQVRQIFAAGPVQNPNGTTGINVIQDYGQGGVFSGGNHVPIANGEIIGGVNDLHYNSVRNANLASNRRGYFRYGLLAHRYGGLSSTGQANFTHAFMVTTACSFSGIELYTFVRNTILHELGHTLSLNHGGAVDDQFPAFCNFKPNYNSVMNYRYQLDVLDYYCLGRGAVPPFPDDPLSTGYSMGLRPTLDETALNEMIGVCGHLGAGSRSIDWNGVGGIEATLVAQDINAELSGDPAVQQASCGGSGKLSLLSDYNDWANMRLARVTVGKAAGHDATTKAIQCQVFP